MRDQRAAQHHLGVLGGFLNGFADAHATLLAGGAFLEGSLAAAAGVDLRLDDPDRAIERAGGGFRLFGPRDGAAIGDRRSVGLQNLFCLILVNIHGDRTSSSRISDGVYCVSSRMARGTPRMLSSEPLPAATAPNDAPGRLDGRNVRGREADRRESGDRVG